MAETRKDGGGGDDGVVPLSVGAILRLCFLVRPCREGGSVGADLRFL